MTQSWIVVRTQPRREQWAEENIQAQGCATYCPMEMRANKRVMPLFPSYLFCRTGDGPWWFLRGTFGVRHPVMVGDEPARVSDRDIEMLREREGRDGFIRLPKKERFAVGQRIQVSEGPMTGVFGIYQGQPQQERAKVLFELMGRKVSTVIQEKFLQPLAA